jgi:hypothetical protein
LTRGPPGRAQPCFRQTASEETLRTTQNSFTAPVPTAQCLIAWPSLMNGQPGDAPSAIEEQTGTHHHGQDDALAQLINGYQVSQALYAATALGVPDLLSQGQRSADELAAATGAHPQAVRRLLRALSAFGVFTELRAGTFANTTMSDRLRAGVPGSQRTRVLVAMGDNYWRTWGALLHSVRTGEPAVHHVFGVQDSFTFYSQDPEFSRLWLEYVAAHTAASGPTIAAACDLSGVHRVVDVGGGHGHLLAAVLRAHSHVRGVLFDLPAVVEHAAPVLEGAGVADRCELLGGDFFSSVPGGGDLYILSDIVHDWPDEAALAILRNCRAAMRNSARMVLSERPAPERAEPTAYARSVLMLDLNMLVRNGGRERTAEEHRALLASAQFRLERILPTAGPTSLLEAVPL